MASPAPCLNCGEREWVHAPRAAAYTGDPRKGQLVCGGCDAPWPGASLDDLPVASNPTQRSGSKR